MTRQPRDLYAVLGVTPDAAQADIGHAYRALLRRHHPDTRESSDPAADDATLQEVMAAYAVLRDPVSRSEYDRRRGPSIPLRVHVRRHDRHEEPRRREQPPIWATPVRWHSGSSHAASARAASSRRDLIDELLAALFRP